MLEALPNGEKTTKRFEHRQTTIAPGWHAVHLAMGAHCPISIELEMRKKFKSFIGPLAYKAGHIYGLVKIGYTLDQAKVAGDEWAASSYKKANVITEIISFTRPGPPASGQLGAWPLKTVAPLLKPFIDEAKKAGRHLKTGVESSYPQTATQPHTATKVSKTSGASVAVFTKEKATVANKATKQTTLNVKSLGPKPSIAKKPPIDRSVDRPPSPSRHPPGKDIKSFFCKTGA